jgi:predicted small integral membrane protein
MTPLAPALTRWAKLIGIAGIALHMSLAAFGNITDYDTNWAFVQHVLAMDTTFQSPALMWRAVTDPALQTAAYLAIIAAETVGAVLLWAGLAVLWRERGAAADRFHAAKGLAVFALAWCFSVWVIGFIAIGGEWFAMWQSPTWNGQETATGFATVTGLVLVFVAARE